MHSHGCRGESSFAPQWRRADEFKRTSKGGVRLIKVNLDRKILAELAVNDTHAFKKLVELAKGV